MQPTESPAEVYERHMVSAMFASWVPALLDLVALKPGEHVLDVACGTGVVARQASLQVGAGGHVVGLDLNGNMLALARVLAPAVEWREGNAMTLPFPTNAFDVVVCQRSAWPLGSSSGHHRGEKKVIPPRQERLPQPPKSSVCPWNHRSPTLADIPLCPTTRSTGPLARIRSPRPVNVGVGQTSGVCHDDEDLAGPHG